VEDDATLVFPLDEKQHSVTLPYSVREPGAELIYAPSQRTLLHLIALPFVEHPIVSDEQYSFVISSIEPSSQEVTSLVLSNMKANSQSRDINSSRYVQAYSRCRRI
jgi:hypothetical protein